MPDNELENTGQDTTPENTQDITDNTEPSTGTNKPYGSTGNYTFYPRFTEFVTLYRGVVSVWIGDGKTTGDVGVLYAEYIDETVQRLGPVSSYAIALAEGYQGTQEEWVAHIAEVSQRALDAEAWARGTRFNEPVTEEDETYHNNSKYYSEQSNMFAYNSQGSADASEASAVRSEGWATGGTGGESSETNNAKYYSEQAEASNQSAYQHEMSAQAYDEEARMWANGGTEETPSATNNALYFSQQSEASANASANSATESADSASASAASAQESGDYAANALQSELNAMDSENAAHASEVAAKESEDEAEMWATGGLNGIPSENNNALYYSQQSANSAYAAAESKQNAAQSEANAAESEQTAHEWANGGEEGDPSVYNNAKYYCDIAVDSAQSIRGATVSVTYQNSTIGTHPPETDEWTELPSPTPGRYMWTRIIITWLNDDISIFHTVSYVGVNGTGAVHSVNGIAGDVIIDGVNIPVNPRAGESGQVYLNQRLEQLDTAITEEQIDALFE